jgi:hypothetical protein
VDPGLRAGRAVCARHWLGREADLDVEVADEHAWQLVPDPVPQPAWVKALENFFAPIGNFFNLIGSIIGGCLGAILMLGAAILGLYLFLVLIKFLWARA